jgi:hypothetical protein
VGLHFAWIWSAWTNTALFLPYEQNQDFGNATYSFLPQHCIHVGCPRSKSTIWPWSVRLRNAAATPSLLYPEPRVNICLRKKKEKKYAGFSLYWLNQGEGQAGRIRGPAQARPVTIYIDMSSGTTTHGRIR